MKKSLALCVHSAAGEDCSGITLREICRMLSDRRIKRQETKTRKVMKIFIVHLGMQIGEELAEKTLGAVKRWKHYTCRLPRHEFFIKYGLPIKIATTL